jgi:hypothetical protein
VHLCPYGHGLHVHRKWMMQIINYKMQFNALHCTTLSTTDVCFWNPIDSKFDCTLIMSCKQHYTACIHVHICPTGYSIQYQEL